MADEFNIVDIVFDAVEGSETGLVLYKDRSVIGEKQNHITVSTTGVNTLDYVNKAPVVNVNIFIIRDDKTGMPERAKMKSVKRKVESALKNIAHPIGMYWKSKIVWCESFYEAKESFDCTNIRLEVITELN